MASILDSYTIEQAESDIATLRGQVQIMQELLALTNGPTPNTPASGTVDLYAVNGQPNYLNAAGLQMGVVGAQNATYPGIGATAASLTTVASGSVPAGDAEVGAVYELEVWGSGTWGSTPQQLTYQITFGGNALSTFTLAASQFPASQGFRWRMVCRVHCTATGSTGSYTSLLHGEVTATNTTNANTTGGAQSTIALVDTQANSTGTTISTTAAQTLALQCAWQSTTGSPVVTSRGAMFKRIA